MLRSLIDAGIDVACVISQPDKPRGRGGKTIPTPVSADAIERGLTLHRPASINEPELLDALAAESLDALCVVGFGQLLRERVLNDWVCLNVHFSILPAYRGAAPVERALMDGCDETGVTIMQMDAGLDTGPIVSIGRIDVGPYENAGSLLDRLASRGGQLLVDALNDLTVGAMTREPQPTDGVSLAPKITDVDIALDLTQSADAVANRVRALAPHIGASLVVDGQRFKIWDVRTTDIPPPPPGALHTIDGRLVAACGSGAITIEQLQPPNRSRMPVDAFLRGWRGGFAIDAPAA